MRIQNEYMQLYGLFMSKMQREREYDRDREDRFYKEIAETTDKGLHRLKRFYRKPTKGMRSNVKLQYGMNVTVAMVAKAVRDELAWRAKQTNTMTPRNA